MTLERFSAPGNLQDLSPALAQGWSDIINYRINQEIRTLTGGNPAKAIRFFKERTSPAPDDAPTKTIPWDGFPKLIRETLSGAERWQAVETEWETGNGLRSLAARAGGQFFTIIDQQPVQVDFGYRSQDEYLEWLVTPGSRRGEIEKVTFTCEPPEYYEFIS